MCSSFKFEFSDCFQFADNFLTMDYRTATTMAHSSVARCRPCGATEQVSSLVGQESEWAEWVEKKCRIWGKSLETQMESVSDRSRRDQCDQEQDDFMYEDSFGIGTLESTQAMPTSDEQTWAMESVSDGSRRDQCSPQERLL